ALGVGSELLLGAVVGLARYDQPLPALEELPHGHVGAQPGREREPAAASFPRRGARRESAAVRCALTAVAVAAWIGAVCVALERGGERNRRRERAGSPIGRACAVH